jgi:hypothetical protein
MKEARIEDTSVQRSKGRKVDRMLSKVGSFVMVLSIVVLPLLASGCYNARVVAPVQGQVGEGSRHAETGVSWLWGMTATKSEAVECPAGLASTETYQPWWGAFFVAPVTAWIVTPIRKEWTCAEKR